MLAEREPEPAPDDEDTLDEMDHVPAVSTMVVSPEQTAKFIEEARKKPPPEKRSRVLPALVLIVVALAVAAIVLWTLTR
jgi:hypothetical protein